MNVIQKNKYEPSRRSQLLLLTAASAAVLAVVPLHAASAEEVDAPAYLLPDMAPVSDSELSANSGGFSFGNLNISFGFTVTTSIQGPMINPVQIVQNFGIESPGHVTDLGTKIHNSANQIAPAVPDAGGSSSADTSIVPDAGPKNPGNDLKVSQNQINLSLPGPSNSSTGQGATGGAAVTDGTSNNDKTSFTKQLDPQTGALTLTNDAGTKVDVSTAHGILTTVTNTLNDVSIKTQIDLNYAVNNYQSIVQNAQAFQQAMGLAQTMLSLHGLSH